MTGAVLTAGANLNELDIDGIVFETYGATQTSLHADEALKPVAFSWEHDEEALPQEIIIKFVRNHRTLHWSQSHLTEDNEDDNAVKTKRDIALAAWHRWDFRVACCCCVLPLLTTWLCAMLRSHW